MAADPPARTKVFISYSHKDEPWLERLRVHLKPVERLHGIDIWHDKKISPGMSWHDEITQALGSAKVAVLLVTADFLASEFIDREEIPPLLEAARAGGAVILPVIVNHSRFSDIESLSRYQAVNDPSKPLEDLSEGQRNKVLAEVSRLVEQIMTGAAPKPAAPRPAAEVARRPPDDGAETETETETESDDQAEGRSDEAATLDQALRLDIEALLTDENIEGLVLSEGGDGDAIDLMHLSVTDDGELACAMASNDDLPDEMQLSPRAQQRLVDEFGFNPPDEAGGAFWQVVDPDEVDLDVLANELLRVLDAVYDVPEDRIEWRSLPD